MADGQTHALGNKHLAKMDGFVSIMSMVVLISYLNMVRVSVHVFCMCIGFVILCVRLNWNETPKSIIIVVDTTNFSFNSICLMVWFIVLESYVSFPYTVHRRAYFASIFFSFSRYRLHSSHLCVVVVDSSFGCLCVRKRDCGMSKICLSMSICKSINVVIFFLSFIFKRIQIFFFHSFSFTRCFLCGRDRVRVYMYLIAYTVYTTHISHAQLFKISHTIYTKYLILIFYILLSVFFFFGQHSDMFHAPTLKYAYIIFP